MKVYALDTLMGLLLITQDHKVISGYIADDSEKALELFKAIYYGEVGENISLWLEGLKDKNIDEIVVINRPLKDFFDNNTEISTVLENNIGEYAGLRRALPEFFESVGLPFRLQDIRARFREYAFMIVREEVRRKSREIDIHIRHIVEILDDTIRTINLYTSRLREWYGFHFPELTDKLVAEAEQYALIVKHFGDRKNITVEKLCELTKIKPERAEEIVKFARNSMGADVDEEQMEVIRSLAEHILYLIDYKRKLDNSLERLIKKNAPNLERIIGPQLTARLINLAGGLRNLAMMPSSTIQILGAEKALFRALKSAKDSPKHGIIYTWPHIRGAKIWQRGKISRLLAGKIGIAAKVDYFKGDFIGDRLAEELEVKVKEIKEKFAEPPKKKKTPKKSGGKTGTEARIKKASARRREIAKRKGRKKGRR